MTNDPTNLPGDDVVGTGPPRDEPVDPDIHDQVPDRLDLPVEVPEADAIEQELEVPIDDDER